MFKVLSLSSLQFIWLAFLKSYFHKKNIYIGSENFFIYSMNSNRENNSFNTYVGKLVCVDFLQFKLQQLPATFLQQGWQKVVSDNKNVPILFYFICTSFCGFLLKRSHNVH